MSIGFSNTKACRSLPREVSVLGKRGRQRGGLKSDLGEDVRPVCTDDSSEGRGCECE